ncbi:O-acetyl-ADP-ribose deacetylase [Lentilactobacillus parafarraginis]|jgi:O-acetyl-ADP-ribose deacetylase (regulator of RNase III)|uniref:O-acetyl-ADP-ribose deacetylase n=1 Tax=Lentilactobacillus parafarraginis TaxID=390842 RepID=A0A5R9CX78_9LACO|nr:O-acetyl-ADP-ribose deacetylase [Lentilactobacillus parafarraginis]TLQ20272.1 O-acetyl-ADP-ribose deacetylase [Lentilactobacillus parafarraginis]
MAHFNIIKGDITQMHVDAIVNAANTALSGGGGVDGAIHRAAGPQLDEACRKLNGCPTGEAKVTPGFNLPAKFVIHTPGPIWHGGHQNEPELLANSYRNSLKRAVENNCHTVAFPSISTGIFDFPLNQAAKIAIHEIQTFEAPLDVTMVCFDPVTFDAYQQEWQKAQQR